MTPHFLSAAEVAEVWSVIEERIAAACEFNGARYYADDYLQDLLDESKQLWLVKDGDVIVGIVVTMLIPFPCKKCCVIDICTGLGLDEWIKFTALVERWAAMNGCKQMLLHARPGMERALNGQGYRKAHVVLEKDLI